MTIFLLFTACFALPDRDICHWETDTVDFNTEFNGGTPESALDYWSGTHEYRSMAPAGDYEDVYGQVPLPASMTSTWSVTIGASGTPVRRSAPDCRDGLAVPVDWTLALSDNSVIASGFGELTDPDNEGSISILGPEPEDWIVELRRWDKPNVSTTDDFWHALGRDPDQATSPNLTFYGSGQLGRLRLSSVSPGATDETTYLHGLRAGQ